MQPSPSILLVEDEAAIRTGLCDVLAFHGYAPTATDTGEEGLRKALETDHALVLLDVMLPGISGFDVCRELRSKRPSQPIVMLTARGSEEDVIRGLRAGADDYVTKPFSIGELIARIDAVLRRAGRSFQATPEAFQLGGWRVDPADLRARSGESTIELSRREVGILALLARERGHIVSRRLLLREVWGMAHVDRIETRTVDVHVAKLRKKLGDDSPIETVRGEGYRIVG